MSDEARRAVLLGALEHAQRTATNLFQDEDGVWLDEGVKEIYYDLVMSRTKL